MLLEKFCGTNFPTWPTKIRLPLMRDRVWDMVEGTERKPKGDLQKMQIWENKNDKALTYIGLGLADNLIRHLDLNKIAKEVWDKLENLFGNKSVIPKVFFKQRFFGFQMKESDSLQEHLSNLRSILQQLAALKAQVDEDDMKAVLLSNIEDIPRFSKALTVLRVAREMSYEEMIAILIDEDRRLREQVATGIEAKTAFISKTKGKGRPFKCTFCNKKLGHTKDVLQEEDPSTIQRACEFGCR